MTVLEYPPNRKAHLARLVAVSAFAATIAVTRAPAHAQTAPPPSPAPSASPAGPSDPCGSIISVVTRPTVTTSVCTVRPREVLLESGYTNTVTTGPGGGNSASYPQAYLRFGTSDPHLEFDVTPPDYNRSALGGAIASGTSDVALGAKYELGYGPRWIYGANAVISYPTGSRDFSAGNAQFTGNFNWSYTVNSVLGLAGTLSFNALSVANAAGPAQSYFAFVPTLEVTASLPGPSEFFGEYAGFDPAGPNLGAKDLFDFGYVRDFGAHVQVDAEYGFSPTPIEGQRSHYLGAGASFMI